jgi:hypothetical protein
VEAQVPLQAVSHLGVHSIVSSSSLQRFSHCFLQVWGHAFRQHSGLRAPSHFVSQSARQSVRQMSAELCVGVTVHSSTQTGVQLVVHTVSASATQLLSQDV